MCVGGGGACPSNFWTGGAPPLQLWTVDVAHFLFCLFLHVNLPPQKKIVGEIRVFLVLGRGDLGPRETFAPPPNFKIVLGPLPLPPPPPPVCYVHNKSAVRTVWWPGEIKGTNPALKKPSNIPEIYVKMFGRFH